MDTPSDGAAAEIPAGRAEAGSEAEAGAGSKQADALRQRIERWVSMSAVSSALAVQLALLVCLCACFVCYYGSIYPDNHSCRKHA